MKKIIVANWKMNPETLEEARRLASAIVAMGNASADIVICPPFPFLAASAEIAKGSLVAIGAQNMSEDEKGPHTGEVSASTLRSVGASYVIVGHSERRSAGETDELINRKMLKALEHGLKPILAVGETERGDDARNVLEAQLQADLRGIPAERMSDVLIAYEPRWAISKGPGDTTTESDTPERASEKSAAIRSVLASMFNSEIGEGAQILYGGSVRSANAAGFLSGTHAFDGALVGGASLDPDEFEKIINAAK